MSIDRRIEEATRQLEADVGLTHDIVNGDENTDISTEGGKVPTHAKVAKDSRDDIIGRLQPTVDDINGHAKYVDGKATDARNSANRAKDAADRAEEISGLEDVHDALRLSAVPEPDFHLPLISNLNLREGFGDVTFTRDSKATYINKSGVLTVAQEHEPRFEKKGILIEGSSTNHLVNTQDPSKWRFHDSHGREVFSLGVLKGVRVTVTDVDVNSNIYFANSINIKGTTAISVFFKPIQGRVRFRIRLEGEKTGFLGDAVIRTDLPEDVSGNNRFVDKLPGGWFRLRWNHHIDNDEGLITSQIQLLTASNAGSSIEGSSVNIMGMQFEPLPFASSYIPTEDAPLTRATDICFAESEKNTPDSSEDITFYINFSNASDNSESENYFPRLWEINGNSDTLNFVHLRTSKPNSIQVRFERSGNLNSFIFNSHIESLFEGCHSLAVVKSGNTVFCYVDGVQCPEELEITKPVLGLYCPYILIGQANTRDGSRAIEGNLNNFRVWHQALTPEQIKSVA